MGLRARIAFASGLGVGLLAGVALPHAARLANASEDDRPAATHRMLDLFQSVLSTVRSDYVRPVAVDTLVDHALEGMVGALDPHSAFLPPSAFDDREDDISGAFGGVGVQVAAVAGGGVEVVAPLDGTPAARAGIRAGDRIVAVDGVGTASMTVDAVLARIKGDPGTPVTLGIRRNGAAGIVAVRLVREIVHVPILTASLSGRTAVIRLSEFDDGASADLRAAWARLQRESGGTVEGVVLDLRNDPGGLVEEAVAVCDALIPRGVIVSTHGRRPDDDRSWTASGSDIAAGRPMVVLINGGTASASEIVAGALKDDGRALLLGTRSFGKGSVQTLIPFGDQGGLVLTTALYYTPSGRSIQDRGIDPDVVVHETRRPDAPEDREAAFPDALRNPGPLGRPTAARGLALPPVAASIPDEPPVGFPAPVAGRPETDFQLQEALRLVGAMEPVATAARAAGGPHLVRHG